MRSIKEFWAGAFDYLDMGEYQLQNLVSRNFESAVASKGDKINVPLTPDFGEGDDYTPGSSITTQDISQEEIEVTLNQSKNKTFLLNDTERSKSAYDLIETFGAPAVKSLMRSVNNYLYLKGLESTEFIDALAGVTEDSVADAGTKLSNNEISRAGRNFVGSPDLIGALKKQDAFQHVDTSGQSDIMMEGLIMRRMGFNFYENNSMAKYTPADVAGAVDNAAGYPAGTTTIACDAFNDDANPIKTGDIFVIAGDTTKQTVVSTTVTAGDTTGITFSPGLGDSVVDDAVITVTPTQSALAFVPGGIALAARSYSSLPDGVGAMQRTFDINGLPMRISVWQADLVLKVQYDILFGATLVNEKRVVRVVDDL